MQIATDIAHGLDYIHNNCSHRSDFSLIHNRIKSSSIIITEPDLQTKICHFGTSYLTEDGTDQDSFSRSESTFEGTRGYMSPEFKHSGVGTQESDVYSYGVVLLELLSGEEPLKYVFERESGVFRRVSIIENAREVLGGGGDDGGGEEGRLRRWMDRRLRDSYPVEVAKEMTRVALECVEEDPEKRPGMGRVAGVEQSTWQLKRVDKKRKRNATYLES
ncbi:Protein kinase domain [Dillenia turbinata]|uniref:Protein kinase domain n=1 Tax=Dillenia turbinata TaxID=194707 RepID=A0AAN8W0L7_9MAGN